jgi:hypothetical protein
MHASTLTQAATWTPTSSPLLLVGVLAAAVVAAVIGLLGVRLARRMPAGTPWWYYAGAAGGLAVSLNTSWRFFGDRLGVFGAERVVMFSVVELALIACALGMRANVRHIDPATGRPGSAGAPRLVAWALCGLSGYAALVLSGPVDGTARVALGPVLSLVMLHLALGIEIRHRATVRTKTWARVAGELRERVLSRLGLADDDRNAATRTRERAVARAARLVVARHAPWRSTRLARSLRAAGVAHDPALRERLLAELAVLRSADQLATLPMFSPWLSVATDLSRFGRHTTATEVHGSVATDTATEMTTGRDRTGDRPTVSVAASTRPKLLVVGDRPDRRTAPGRDRTGRSVATDQPSVDISDLLPAALEIATELGSRPSRDALLDGLRSRGLSVGGRRRSAIHQAVLDAADATGTTD